MTHLQISIVSDIMCPWCIIGYKSLEQALKRVSPDITAELKWLPFELNPDMPEEGQDLREHLMEKYGITAQQSDQNRDQITARGKEVGFEFRFSNSLRMVNSFDCHRLLAWAVEQGKQHELQLALFQAHFQDNIPLNDYRLLADLAGQAGLDPGMAIEVLTTGQYADIVRAEQKESFRLGIQSVPTFIINNKYAINGGQPAEVFEQALNQIAEQQAETTS